MSEPPEAVANAIARARQAQRASEARAREFHATAPRCDVCGNLIATRGRTRHYLCDRGEMAGRSCTCPPGCTDKRYGDTDVACDPECVPCHLRRGQVYVPTRKRHDLPGG